MCVPGCAVRRRVPQGAGRRDRDHDGTPRRARHGSAAAPGTPAAAPGAPARRRAPPKPVPAQLPAVIARVNGEDVKKEDFDRIIHTMEARAGQPIPADRRDEILRGAIDQLVVYTLLSQESRNRGIKIDDTEIDAKMAQLRGAVPDAGGVRQGAQGARHDGGEPAQGRARRPQRHQADGGRNRRRCPARAISRPRTSTRRIPIASSRTNRSAPATS